MQHKFKVGDKVKFEPRPHSDCGGSSLCRAADGIVYKVSPSTVYFGGENSGTYQASAGSCLSCLIKVKIEQNQNQPQEVVMNEVIAGLYEKTADAVVVHKWFGAWIGNSPGLALLLKLNKEAFLKEAQTLEAEQKAEEQVR